MNIEAGLIGALLTHPEDITTTQTLVTAEMFVDESYRSVYQAIAQGHTDLVTLNSIFQARYVNIGEILRDCVKEYEAGTLTKQYVQAIRNEHRKRTLKTFLESELNNLTGANVNQSIDKIVSTVEELKPKQKTRAVGFDELRKYKDEYFKPKEKNFLFGFEEVDNKTGGIDKGDICVIAARPAVGKSAFALQVIKNNKNFKGGYFNLEMSERQIYERLIASQSGIDVLHMRRAEHYNNDEKERFDKANDSLDDFKDTKIITGIVSIKEIKAITRQEKFDFIVVDYLQLIKPDIGRGSNRTAEVGDISRGLKEIASDLNIPVIALSQLNRRSEAASDKEPTMAELRESGAIEQDASTIIILWTHEEPEKRNYKVEKARTGVLGKSEIYFDGAHMTFSEKPIKDFKPVAKEEVPFD